MQLEGTNISGLITRCNLHQHPCWEIILNIQGEGIETIGTQTHRFYPGSVTLCPPYIPHIKETESPGSKWQDIYLKFSDESGIFSLESQWLEDDVHRSLETILRLLQGLYYDPAVPRRASQALAETACTLVSHWLTGGRKDKITEQIKREISLHFSDPEFSAMLAMKKMNYCPDHIRRVFRQDTGMTPTAFLLQTRLTHARQLLEEPSPAYSIREIAFLSGFYDPEYFCKCFHRAYGISPRLHQNKYKKASS